MSRRAFLRACGIRRGSGFPVWEYLPRATALTSHAAVESRALRGSLSCMDKRRFSTVAGWSSNQRNHPSQPVVRALRGRSASTRAFPEGTSMCRPETSRIVRAALRVFAPPACRASTGNEGQDQEHSLLMQFHLCSGCTLFRAFHARCGPCLIHIKAVEKQTL